MSEDNLINVGLNVTRRCNLQCSFCYYGNLHFEGEGVHTPTDRVVDLPLELAYEKLGRLNINEIYLCGGEPLTYPHLRELILWLRNRASKVILATNGLLLTPEWLAFLREQNARLLMSVKSAGVAELQKFIRAGDAGVETHVYHILTKDSIPVLRTMVERFHWVDHIRFLYGTPSEANGGTMLSAAEWLPLLKLACHYLGPIASKVDVEIGFAPFSHPLGLDDRRGAVKRFYMDIDGLVYPCPLLVERGDGVAGNEPRDCDIHRECPALSRSSESSSSFLIQICPFVLARLTDVTSFLSVLERTASRSSAQPSWRSERGPWSRMPSDGP